MPVEIKTSQTHIPDCHQDFMMVGEMALSELLSRTTQRKFRRNLVREYGVILKARRKERGVTMIELSGKTGVSRDDIELAERGLLRLPSEEKQRISKFLKRQRII